MTYISIVHDEKTRKKHITVDKDGEVRHYVVNDTVLDALITQTMFPGSRIRPAGSANNEANGANEANGHNVGTDAAGKNTKKTKKGSKGKNGNNR